MQKLETRNGTLWFVEVPENTEDFSIDKDRDYISATEYLGFDRERDYFSEIIDNISKYEMLGEVTKEGITFDCQKYLWLHSEFNRDSMFLAMMCGSGIELKEGYKFVVLKEKSQ